MKQKLYKRYGIISKGLTTDFAHEKRYRYKGLIFRSRIIANKYFNNLPYENQRNQKVVMFVIR